MAGYRVEVVHVGYWRGQVKRWVTNYPYNGSASPALDTAACDIMKTRDSQMCWGSASATNGGISEVRIYNAGGGTPIVEKIYFDWTTPAAWIPYTSTGWTTTGRTAELVGEGALLVEWPGGLSSTGKPVKFKKFYHAIPAPSANGAVAQVQAADVTSLTAVATGFVGALGAYGLVMGSASGRLAGSAVVSPYYAAHQRRRGRRKRTVAVSQSQYERVFQILENQAYGATTP